MAPQYSMFPLGESALLLRVSAASDAECFEALIRCRNRIEQSTSDDLIESVPAIDTLAVHFDRRKTDFDRVRDRVLEALHASRKVAFAEPVCHEVPVCYDVEFAWDLASVAESTRLSIQQVIDLHSRSEYRVRMVGFSPGFPYLSGLDPLLHVPRRSAPRTSVPAGSVAIAAGQTGIYPNASPGGWQIIGRTPLKLFDAFATPHSLFAVGDRARFQPISLQQFRTHYSEP